MAGVKGKDNYTVMPQINSVDIVPSGGTTGQVLTKINATNYNYSWQTPSAGGKLVKYTRQTVSAQSGGTTIPYDNTVPLSTEGTQIWTTSYTPLSASNVVRIHLSGNVDTGSNGRGIIFALFRGTTCIDVSTVWVVAAGDLNGMGFTYTDSPATTSAITYSIRVGIFGGGGNWYVVNDNSGIGFGGTSIMQVDIMEIAP